MLIQVFSSIGEGEFKNFGGIQAKTIEELEELLKLWVDDVNYSYLMMYFIKVFL